MMNPSSTANEFQSGAARVADAVSDVSETAGQETKKFVQTATDSVKNAADYVRDTGGEMGVQLRDYLKANPSHALIGAAVVGFFLGRLMSRD